MTGGSRPQKLRADVAPERELELRHALRRNKELLFEALATPAVTPRRRTHYAAALVLAASAAAWLTWMQARPAPTLRPTTTLAATAVLQPAGPAAFARRAHPSGEHVTLSEGTLAFRTHGASPKLRVRVPDGELEDVGTAFRVTVADGRTTSIEVTEGLVIFHRREGEDIRLPAGSHWLAPAPRRNTEAPIPSAARSPRAAPAVASSPAVSAETAESGEDSAYLHILALLREDRREEARVAAREYLRRYPLGFRRVEVERLTRETP